MGYFFKTVEQAHNAFLEMGSVDDDSTQSSSNCLQITYQMTKFSAIKDSNDEDVRIARSKGRSTTRLILEKMRTDMVAGLRLWENTPSQRGSAIEEINPDGGMLN